MSFIKLHICTSQLCLSTTLRIAKLLWKILIWYREVITGLRNFIYLFINIWLLQKCLAYPWSSLFPWPSLIAIYIKASLVNWFRNHSQWALLCFVLFFCWKYFLFCDLHWQCSLVLVLLLIVYLLQRLSDISDKSVKRDTPPWGLVSSCQWSMDRATRVTETDS